MSEIQESNKMETLFSFELLVDSVRLDKETKVSDELAVALRLLDFPTLIIYQPEHKGVKKKEGEYTFNRGKACFFKMNMDPLHNHLSNTPLYVMVLDVKEEIPKFVGSSLISLAKVMDRIRQDVSERGVSTPSSHGQRGTVSISNLSGEKVGTISLSYKLLSLGSSLMSHISDKVDSKTLQGQCLKEINNKKEADELHVDPENVHLSKSEQDEESGLSKNRASTKQGVFPSKCQVTDNSYGEDMSVFFPPHLYYNNSAEERRKYEEENYKLHKLNLEAFAFEDSGDETEKKVHLKEQKYIATNSNQEKLQVSTEVTPNVIDQALREMPLLSALLVELSQLNTSNANQAVSIHPNLAWIYRPPSTETSAVERNTPRKSHKDSKSRQVTSPKLKDLYSLRRCSTPIQETDRKNTPRKKLVYGTTKSFNLRLKQNSPTVVKRRECMELIQSKTPLNSSKEKPKSGKKLTKSGKRKCTQISNLTENIETMIQSITVESTPRGSFTEKHKNVAVAKSIGITHEDTASPNISEKPLLIESPSRLIHIPTNVESDIAQNNSEKINQSQSDTHSGKCSGSSSPDSSVSDPSRGEADYADDFNSFEPSDAFSPDPMSSPEPHRPKTPNSPSGRDFCRSSDSSSESVQKRAVLPVPVKASRSPQRALRSTYNIQRQTYGISFSSEDGDRDGTTSILTAHSGKRLTERSSGESFRSSGDHKSESDKSRPTIKGISDESPFEHKAEEDDELGTLDFKKGYKHISELVAQKLPGYTM